MQIRSRALLAVVCAATLLIGSGTALAQTRLASTAAAPTALTADGAPPAATEPADPPATEGDTPPQASQPQITVSGTPDGFRVGDFTFKIGGRVKLDIIRDFNPIGSEDSFDPRTIPIPQQDGQNSNLHAKETRLNVDIRGPVQGKELRMYIETDFYGSSAVLRLRHAYGSWGPILAGQTWSAFVDEDNMPRTIDFESPMAFASVRQAQVRFTKKMGEHSSAAVALEDNKSSISIPSTVPGKAEYPYPDFTTRYRFDDGKRHLQLSGMLGGARFRPTTGDPNSALLYGLAASGKLSTGGRQIGNFMTSDKDSGYATLTWGAGLGRYRGGITAVPDPNNELHAVGGIAWMVGYEHFWTSVWSTNATYSGANTSDEPYYTSAINQQINYGAVNLLYWFLGDHGWMGVEYLYGHREVFGGGDDNAAAHRVQYAVRFNFP
jgi:outer membrane DcaP-like protein